MMRRNSAIRSGCSRTTFSEPGSGLGWDEGRERKGPPMRGSGSGADPTSGRQCDTYETNQAQTLDRGKA